MYHLHVVLAVWVIKTLFLLFCFFGVFFFSYFRSNCVINTVLSLYWLFGPLLDGTMANSLITASNF